MARVLYGGSGADVIAEVTIDDGDYGPATATFDVFTDRACTSQVTDLLDAASSPITAVTPDAEGRILFFGVDGYAGPYYLQDQAAPSSEPWLVLPSNLALRVDDHETRVTALEGSLIYPDISDITGLQTALDGKQPLDADLTTIGGLSPANDDLLQRKSGAWTNRTPAQVKADLGIAAGFVMTGTVPGDLDVGELVEGGVSVPIATTLNKVLLTVDREPRGADLVISVIKRERTTGTETTLGTATITSNVSKRATITGLSTSLAVDDRLMLRCTSIGSNQPGSGLEYTLLDATAPTLPAALSAPAAPTGGSTDVSGTTVTVSWTAPASGTYHAVDVFKDGAWVARVLKGTNEYADLDAADDSHDYDLYAVNNDAVSSGLAVNYVPGASTIGDPVDLGLAVYGGASTASVLEITVGTACSAGDMVVVACGGSVPGDAGVTVTVTDDRSNSYTTHVHPYDETHSQQVAIISSKITTGLQVGDKITITWSVATARLMARAYKVTGIAAASHFDKSASRNVFTANATVNLSTNATATLAQAKEIAFACYSVQWNAGQGVSTGWSLGTVTESGATSNNKALIPTWRIVDSTAALTGTGTLNSSAAQSCAIATFKGA